MPESGETIALGKAVSTLQENIVIDGRNITGTVKYITGYTGYSDVASEQAGYFLAMRVKDLVPSSADVKVSLISGDYVKSVYLGANKMVVARLNSTIVQELDFDVSYGLDQVTETYSLANLQFSSN